MTYFNRLGATRDDVLAIFHPLFMVSVGRVTSVDPLLLNSFSVQGGSQPIYGGWPASRNSLEVGHLPNLAIFLPWAEELLCLVLEGKKLLQCHFWPTRAQLFLRAPQV